MKEGREEMRGWWKESVGDPRVVLGCVHLLCICTVITTLTTFFAVGHNVREVCELIKESDLYKSFKVDMDKICHDRLPTISYTGILLPEQGVFAVGLSLAGLLGLWAHYLIGKTQVKAITDACAKQGKDDFDFPLLAPPMFMDVIRLVGLCVSSCTPRRNKKEEQMASAEQEEEVPKAKHQSSLVAFCRKTIRVGQTSCFFILPTACVSMKHNIAVHGLAACFFFGFACAHVVCSYVIQYNLIAHKIIVNESFDKSFNFKSKVLMGAVVFFVVGSIVYFSLRFGTYQIYLYTVAAALGQYTTVLWLMAGYGTYYIDLTILVKQEKIMREEEVPTISL